jgi:hypothetical protein
MDGKLFLKGGALAMGLVYNCRPIANQRTAKTKRIGPIIKISLHKAMWSRAAQKQVFLIDMRGGIMRRAQRHPRRTSN